MKMTNKYVSNISCQELLIYFVENELQIHYKISLQSVTRLRANRVFDYHKNI